MVCGYIKALGLDGNGISETALVMLQLLKARILACISNTQPCTILHGSAFNYRGANIEWCAFVVVEY